MTVSSDISRSDLRSEGELDFLSRLLSFLPLIESPDNRVPTLFSSLFKNTLGFPEISGALACLESLRDISLREALLPEATEPLLSRSNF